MHYQITFRNLIIFTCLALSLFQCDNGGSTKSEYEPPQDDESIICARTATVGLKDFCLPEFEGLKECKDHPSVDSMLKLTTDPHQIVMGYYLNDVDYKAIDTLLGLARGDYVMVYSEPMAYDDRFEEQELNEIYEELGKGVKQAPWEVAIKELQQQRNNSDRGGRFLIEKYAPFPQARTCVTLSNLPAGEGETQMSAAILNILIVYDRIVSLSYSHPFTGEQSLEPIKAINDRFIKALIDANPWRAKGL